MRSTVTARRRGAGCRHENTTSTRGRDLLRVERLEAQLREPAQRREGVADGSARALLGGHDGRARGADGAARCAAARAPSSRSLRAWRRASRTPGETAGSPESRALSKLALRELEAGARAALAVLLALDLARVAREQPARFLSAGRWPGSSCSSARAMPWRSAPAWPAMPPPRAWRARRSGRARPPPRAGSGSSAQRSRAGSSPRASAR